MKKHYICVGGCRGVSETPGVCNTQGCPKEGHLLRLCECADGKHGGAFDKEAHSTKDEKR